MSTNVSVVYKSACYTHLSFEERIIIETLSKEGKTQKYIADKLKRDQSTISRELRRNQPPKNKVSYNGSRSHERAIRRRCAASRRGRLRDQELRDCVVSMLEERYTPEGISGFLRKNTQ